MNERRDFSDYAFRVELAAELSDDDRAAAMALFASNYREANQPYLERSFDKLRNFSIATHDGEPAGFALGEYRVLDLPRLPQQAVVFAGICCVAFAYRRRGLFGQLERLACSPGPGVSMPARLLNVGRMAHPVSYRTMSRGASPVPRPGVAPTRWQQEVGQAIANVYGVHEFDPQTFVCIGAGTPIGYPVMEIDVLPEEWQVFEHVDRSRGDALLGMSWMPDAPPGWDD